MRCSIEALYGTNDGGAKVLHLLTTSLTAGTYSNYEGKIRLFADFYIHEETIDMERALQIRQLKTNEELRRDHLACDVITDILDDFAGCHSHDRQRLRQHPSQRRRDLLDVDVLLPW
eukprot:jgi/Tetstr1/461798/TSEL_006885.t1